MSNPKVCILRTDGTNCDEELFYAFEKYGGNAEYVHVNQLRAKLKKLRDYSILALPGGFTYGDDIASGKILAVELSSFLKDELMSFIDKGGLILGVCNGFQVLVRTGLLPFSNIGKMDATLAQNESGHFECRWVRIRSEKSRCVFFPDTVSGTGDTVSSGLSGIFEVAVNHGEGKFFADPKTLEKIENQSLVVFRYVDEAGQQTQKYPQNPNGAMRAIAGITDSTGRILGIMPHPEKFVDITQHPNWRRKGRSITKDGDGAFIFKGMINYAKKN